MDSATPPAPNGDAPGTGARLDDKEIWRLKHEEHLTHIEIMQRVGCAKGSVTKALQREEARRDQQPDTANRNGDAPGGVTEATPGQTPAVAEALAKATAAAKAPEQSGEAVGTELEPISETVAEDLTADEARALTDQIKVRAQALLALIVRAFKGRVWIALNYRNWDDYCAHELPGLRVPREEREELVASLLEEGMSKRAVAAGLGVSEGTVRNDVNASAQNYAPDSEPGEPIDAEIVDTPELVEPEKIEPITELDDATNEDEQNDSGGGGPRRDSVDIFADELVAVVHRGQQLLVKLPTARWAEIEEAMEWPMSELDNMYKSVANVAANNAKEQVQS